MKKSRTPRVTAAVLIGATALSFAEWRPRAAGTIAGVVFEDFNANGVRDETGTIDNSEAGTPTTVSTAIDRGVGGVTVTVFDSAGVEQGTATTAADGNYSIAATGTGPYRVEFTALPTGYFPSRFAGGPTGNGTTVQFVPDGTTANVNLGILDPANFCENNPQFAISCYVFGDQLGGPNASSPVVVDFFYSYGSGLGGLDVDYFRPVIDNDKTKPVHTLTAPASKVGTTYGMAYRKGTDTLYTGAFMKKHAGFGPQGPGAIYAINPRVPDGGPPQLPFITIPNAGADPHNPLDYIRDNDNIAWDAVGKRSLGGLEISPDGAFLYVVNLFDRQVYKVPTAGGAMTSVPVPVPASAVPASGADIRPFALQYYKGLLYVGMVNSAESTQNPADLRAYVYALDPVSMTFSGAPVFEMTSLQYPRGYVQNFLGLSPGAWNPWRPTFASNASPADPPSPRNIGTYPQPMLTGLSFDVDGNLTLGFRDRAGDQFGYFAYDDPATTQLWEGVASGDTLIAEINQKGDVTSGWTLENNAATTSFISLGGANTAQGPGGGEYFYQDNYEVLHQEITAGALLQVPGFPDVMTSSMNPGLSKHSGGVMWMSQKPGVFGGNKTKAYVLYETPQPPEPLPPPPPPPTWLSFSKTNGLGEFVVMCTAAPIEIGNRVWDDLDGDGVQDAGEPGLDGVTVQLIAPGGAVLASVVTANGGQYYFSSQTITGLTPNTAGYVVRITGGQPALGLRNLTIANNGGAGNGDSRDSDASTVAGNAEIVVNTGAAGNNNHTYDFGYTQVPPPLSLGNLVWLDANNDGLAQPTETGIPGVTVRLFDVTGTMQLATQQTDGGGFYLFNNLAAGQYIVEVVIPTGLTSSTGTPSTYEPAPDPDNDIDNDDNGTTQPGGVVRSLPVTLALNTEPDSPVDGNGTNSNLTVDFGFFGVPPPPPLSLGNLVWVDDNDDALVSPARPGARAEPGIPNVPVRLFDGDGTTLLRSTTTNANGNYLFTGLAEGKYIVEITPPQRTPNPPRNLRSSTDRPSSANPDNNIDNDDNGLGQSFNPVVIRSAPVTLTLGQEPTNDGDNDPNSNLTVDFGIPPPGGTTVLCLDPPPTPAFIRAGVPFKVSFAVTNVGPDPAENVFFDQMLNRSDLKALKVTPSGQDATCTLKDVDPQTAEARCTWSDPTPVGASRSAEVELVSNAQPGKFVQIWAMGGAENSLEDACNLEFDGYLSMDGGGLPADLAITGLAQSSSQPGPLVAAPVNQPVQTRFSVTNTGSVPASGRYEIFLQGAPLTLIEALWSPQGSAGRVNAKTGWWETGAISPGATATFNMTFMPQSGGVTKVLAIRSQGSSFDPDASNDTASFVIDGVDGANGGGRSVAVGNVDGVPGGEILTGAGRGESSQLRVFSGSGSPLQTFYPFARLVPGGVRVAACNVNGDGRDEIVAAMGPGGGRVRVLSLAGGIVTDVVPAFDAFESGFTGGVNVACADVDGDGKGEVVVAPDGGREPEVRVYDVDAGGAVEAARFMAYESSFRGGVRVAAAPFAGSGVVGAFSIVTMPGPGRAGELRTWSVSGASFARGLSVVAGPASGARVALGDANGDGGLDLLVMPDDGVSALISVYSLTTGAPLFSAPSGAAGFRSLDGAVGVLGGGPGVPEVVVGRGPGQSPDIVSFRVLSGGAIVPRLFFSAFEVP